MVASLNLIIAVNIKQSQEHRGCDRKWHRSCLLRHSTWFSSPAERVAWSRGAHDAALSPSCSISFPSLLSTSHSQSQFLRISTFSSPFPTTCSIWKPTSTTQPKIDHTWNDQRCLTSPTTLLLSQRHPHRPSTAQGFSPTQLPSQCRPYQVCSRALQSAPQFKSITSTQS